MKTFLKLSLLLLAVIISGSLSAQKYTSPFQPNEDNAFRDEMNRLDSICNAISPSKNIKNTEQWYEPESVTMFDMMGNPTFRHLWTYEDVNNTLTRNVLSEIWEGWQAAEEKFIPTDRKTFTYDENGNWIQAFLEKRNGNTWVPAFRMTCKYNDKNLMISQHQELMYEGRWASFLRWTKQYDEKDSLIDIMFERATEDGIWVKTTHQIWKYDTKGNLLQKAIQTLNLGEGGYVWGGYTGWSYEYNEAGHKILGVAYSLGDSTGRETYTVDSEGNTLSYTMEKRENNAWIGNYRSLYTYENGLKKTQNYLRFRDSEWDSTSIQEWDYDANKNVIKFIEDAYDSIGQRANFMKTLYTYNSNNQLLTFQRDMFNGKKWIDDYDEEYTYDAKFNKTRETWHTPRTIGDTLVFTKIVDITWTYDELGNSTMAQATALPEKVGYFLYYNNSAVKYGVPHFLMFTTSATYTDIKSGVKVTDISLNQTNITLDIRETFQLEAKINTTEATNKEVRWTSSDEKIAVVSSEGNVRALKGGSATITATAIFGGVSDHCEVNVRPVSNDEMQKGDIEIYTLNDQIHINSTIPINGIIVRDMLGRIVYQSQYVQQIPTSSWTSGIYLISLFNNLEIIKSSKIIVN